MPDDNKHPTVVHASMTSLETTIHRVGGRAGVQVTHASIGHPTAVKRVTALNDVTDSVTIHRATVARVRELLERGTLESVREAFDLLPEV